MPKGLAVPVYVNKGGGAKVQPDDTQLDKLIVLAVQEGDDDNPFQDLGLSQRIIYDINDDGSKFDVKGDVERVLKSFDGRMKLDDDGVVIAEEQNDARTSEGEMNVSFGYFNLEVDDERDFAIPFKELGDN